MNVHDADILHFGMIIFYMSNIVIDGITTGQFRVYLMIQVT